MAIAVDQLMLIISCESGKKVKAHSEVESFDNSEQREQTHTPVQQGRHGTVVVEFDGYFIVASDCLHRSGEPALFATQRILLKK